MIVAHPDWSLLHGEQGAELMSGIERIRSIERPPTLSRPPSFAAYESSLLPQLADVVGYARWQVADMTPLPPRPLPPQQNPSATFNPPQVETVRLPLVRAAATPADAWLIDTVSSLEAFQRNVLLPADQRPQIPPEPQPSCRMPHIHVAELIRTRYIRPRVHGVRNLPPVVCRIFSVPRSDGRLRLIWDGRRLNLICIRPPPVDLPRMADDMRDAGAAESTHAVVWDFTSWFVQLAPHPDIAATYFVTRDAHGALHVLAGIPMGFSWAPAVAQAVSRTFVAEVIRRLAAEGINVTSSSVYIDNCRVLLSQAAHVPRARAIVEALAGEWNTIIKPSSWETGTSFEWRGLVTDLSTHTYKFKDSFIAKIRAAIAAADDAKWELSKTDTFALISCIIYTMWVREEPLAHIIDAMRCLSRRAGDGQPPEHVARVPKAAAEQISRVAATLADPRPMPTRKSRDPSRVCVGASDAAGPADDGSSRARAFAFHSSSRMVIQVAPISDGDIFIEELRAMTEGVCEAAKDASVVDWGCDNLRALYTVDRGWSAMWTANEQIARLTTCIRDLARSNMSYVPSRSNPLDRFTRDIRPEPFVKQAPACAEHPGTWCPCFAAWLDAAHASIRVGPDDAPSAKRARTATQVTFATHVSFRRVFESMPVDGFVV